MPVIVLAGEEEFQIARDAKRLKAELVDPAWETFNFARIENPDLKQATDAAATLPFGPGNRMVLFEQCALFTKKRGGKDDGDTTGSAAKSSKLVDDFESAMGKVAANTYLVFACIANFDANLKVSKAISKHSEMRAFPRIKYYAGSPCRELITFGNAEAHRHKANIEDDAIYYLAESSEVNLRQMASEIEKSAVYILPEKTIRLEHVMMLSPHFSQVFALTEHWAAGDAGKVLSVIQELQSRQMSPHMVVATMQTILSKWIYYKSEYDKVAAVPSGGREVGKREINLRDLANRINPHGAYMIEKDLRRIKGLPLEILVRKKRELTDLEQKVKTGQMPETHILEVFFTR